MPADPNFDDRDFVPVTEDVEPQDSSGNDLKRWLVPVGAVGCGCLGLGLLAIALSLLGIGSTVRKLYQSTGTYQVYQIAAAAVETDAAVQEALGRPLESGWTSQSIERYEAGDQGIVCLRFNVIGANRSGSAYAEAQKIQGAWQLYQLFVAVNGQPDTVPVVPLPEARSSLCPDFEVPEPAPPTPASPSPTEI
jgi:hypothetical protein